VRTFQHRILVLSSKLLASSITVKHVSCLSIMLEYDEVFAADSKDLPRISPGEI
jgi:hypothetical protein